MSKFKSFLLFIFTLIAALGCSITSFAITSYSDLTFSTFNEGPWAGQRVSMIGVRSDGSFFLEDIPDWRDGTGPGTGYYEASGSTYLDGYIMSKDGVLNNICLVSTSPLDELYAVDYQGNVIADILDDAFIASSSYRYFYGISVQNGTGVAFRSSSLVMMTEFSSAFYGGQYYDFVNNNLPYLSGVYDGNSVAVRYPGMLYDSLLSTGSTYGFNYLYFPVVAVPGGGSDRVTTWYFNYGDGVLHEGSKYTFNFKVNNISNGRIFINDPSDYTGASVNGNNFTASITGQDVSLSNLGFGFRRSSAAKPLGICFTYLSSTSEDIGTVPPDDSGGSGGSGSPDYSSALSNIGSTLKSLMQNVSSGTTTIVNNITNQTTQISNTISNVSNQITNTLQNVQQGLENKLQGVEEGISNTIEQSNQELIQNDEKLHSEKLEADKENTQAVTDAVEEHGNFIIEGLKGLFIPSDEFFKTYFDDLYEFFNDKFGFLSFPIDLLVRLVDLFVNSSDKDCILTLPEFEISGEQLITEASFNLTEFLENDFGILLSSIRLVTSIGLIMAFVNLCQDKWNEVMRN